MKTTVVNIRKHEFDLYIGRACPRRGLKGSKWANPFAKTSGEPIGDVLAKYEKHLRSRPDLMAALSELEGLRLACWCVDEPIDYVRDNPVCHGEIILKLMVEFGLI